MKKKLVSFALAALLLVGGLPVQAQPQRFIVSGFFFRAAHCTRQLTGFEED